MWGFNEISLCRVPRRVPWFGVALWTWSVGSKPWGGWRWGAGGLLGTEWRPGMLTRVGAGSQGSELVLGAPAPSRLPHVLWCLAQEHKKPPEALSRRETCSMCILKRWLWLDFAEWTEVGQEYRQSRQEAPVGWWELGLPSQHVRWGKVGALARQVSGNPARHSSETWDPIWFMQLDKWWGWGGGRFLLRTWGATGWMRVDNAWTRIFVVCRLSLVCKLIHLWQEKDKNSSLETSKIMMLQHAGVCSMGLSHGQGEVRWSLWSSREKSRVALGMRCRTTSWSTVDWKRK